MTVDDCRLLAWFLQQTRPVTVRHLMDEFDLPERTARRRLAVFRRAGLSRPAGIDAGRRFEWLPDRMRPEDPRIREVTAWIAMARDQAGFTNADLDRPFGFAGMAGHWTTTASQPTIPTPEQWAVLARMFNRAGVDVPGTMHDAVEDLNDAKGTWGNERDDRKLCK